MVMSKDKKQSNGSTKKYRKAQKKQSRKKYETIFWIFFDIVGGIFILYLIIGAAHKKHSLDKNRVRSKAIVDDFFSIRYTDFFGYHFLVGDKEYQGSGWYYPESDTLSVGDTVIIYYDSTNPDNNKLEREYTW